MAYSLENLVSRRAHHRVAWPLSTYPTPSIQGSIRYWVFSLLVFAAVYPLFIKRIEKNGLCSSATPVVVVVAALVIAVNMMLDLVVKDIIVPDLGVPEYDTTMLNAIYLLLCVYIMYSVFEIVYNRRLQMNMAAIERLRATEARQYQMSRENIEAINIKCHDLKHRSARWRAAAPRWTVACLTRSAARLASTTPWSRAETTPWTPSSPRRASTARSTASRSPASPTGGRWTSWSPPTSTRSLETRWTTP